MEKEKGDLSASQQTGDNALIDEQNRRSCILFVEDDMVDQMAFKRFVRHEDFPYDYILAGSVQEARQILKSESFDAAVTDYLLGDGTAFDLFDELKGTPFIIVTGAGDQEIAVKAMKAGAYDYVIKDPEGKHLQTLPMTVENAIQRKHAEKELKKYKEHLEELVHIRTAELQKEIEERKQVEEALRESETKFRLMAENVPGVIYLYKNDERHTMLYLNDAVKALTGYSKEDFLADKVSFVELYHPDDAPKIANIVAQMLEKQEPFHFVYRLKHRSGLWRWIDEMGVGVFRNNELLYIEGFLSDVTKARKLEQSKTNFLNAISHELRTPLTPIIGYIDLLRRMELSPPANKFIIHISKNIERERLLVEELLDVVQIEKHIEVYNFSEQNVYELLFNIATDSKMLIKQMIEERYRTTDFEYSYNISEDLKNIMVKVDSIRIEQVIENLLTNAIKYSPQERLSIKVSAKRNQDWIEVSVADRGKGIDESERQQIFEPFYQIRERRFGVTDGVGQGLWLTKKYVEAHGGTISVESKPDQGSRFIFSLPILCQA